MYFNDNMTQMFERIAGGRCFIYKRVEDEKWKGKVMWN